MQKYPTPMSTLDLWGFLTSEAAHVRATEPLLGRLVNNVFRNVANLSESLITILSLELATTELAADELVTLGKSLFNESPHLNDIVKDDLIAIIQRDPAARRVVDAFLFYKGFHALESYRLSHALWQEGRQSLALYLQGLIARKFAVDIHPAAKLGRGIMIDHAHGIVIGETAVVDDHVSFLHSVTLGGTGNEVGDRHPKIRSGVLIGAGAKILGNIVVGEGARIAAGSVVLEAVPPHVTVAGVPARIIGQAGCPKPAETMDHTMGVV